MKPWLVRLSLSLCLLVCSVQAETNYCEDAAANREWAERLRNSPEDNLLLNLFALRLGLCEMGRVNMIGLVEAAELFEEVRVKAVQQRQTEEFAATLKRPA